MTPREGGSGRGKNAREGKGEDNEDRVLEEEREEEREGEKRFRREKNVKRKSSFGGDRGAPRYIQNRVGYKSTDRSKVFLTNNLVHFPGLLSQNPQDLSPCLPFKLLPFAAHRQRGGFTGQGH